MKKVKHAVIRAIDWFDDRVLKHCFHPWLCTWIVNSSWWPDDHEDYSEK